MSKQTIFWGLLILFSFSFYSCEEPRPSKAPNQTTPFGISEVSDARGKITPKKQAQCKQYTIGRNDCSLQLEGSNRNFIVHIPSNYTKETTLPVVFMFHGTGSSGAKFHRQSGWKEKADTEGFIVVFPTAMTYYLTEERRKKTKWHIPQLEEMVKAGTFLYNDLEFVANMIEHLNRTVSIDPKRIYASGFSNGAAFVKHLSLKLPEKFAAAAIVSGGIRLSNEVSEQPIPFYLVLGEEDPEITARLGISSLPMEETAILGNMDLKEIIDGYLETFQLTKEHTTTKEKKHTTLHYTNNKSETSNEFVFSIIRGLRHRYPTTKNNLAKVNIVDIFWDFFKKHKATVEIEEIIEQEEETENESPL